MKVQKWFTENLRESTAVFLVPFWFVCCNIKIHSAHKYINNARTYTHVAAAADWYLFISQGLRENLPELLWRLFTMTVIPHLLIPHYNPASKSPEMNWRHVFALTIYVRCCVQMVKQMHWVTFKFCFFFFFLKLFQLSPISTLNLTLYLKSIAEDADLAFWTPAYPIICLGLHFISMVADKTLNVQKLQQFTFTFYVSVGVE